MDNNFKKDLSAIAGGGAPAVAPDLTQAQPQAPMTHADVLKVIDMVVPHMIDDAIAKALQGDQADPNQPNPNQPGLDVNGQPLDPRAGGGM